MQKIKGVLKLTRANEYYATVFLLTSIGFLVIAPLKIEHASLLYFANVFSTAFTFMINDVEDADDDALDPDKKTRNPISAGILSKKEGYIATTVVCFSSLLLYLLMGRLIFLLGLFKIVLGFLYSWKYVRLKSLPFIDILSHGVFLGAMNFFIVIALKPEMVSFWAIVLLGIPAFLSSALGDVGNEIRDFEVDQKANLKNTASFINLIKLKPYILPLEVIVLLVAFGYAISLMSFFVTLLFVGSIIAVGVHYYLYWHRKNQLIFEYPLRQPVFVVWSMFILLEVFPISIPFFM